MCLGRDRTQHRADRRILIAILWMCFAGMLFSLMGGFAKILGASYSSIQVSWARAFIHLVFLAAVFMPSGGIAVLRSRSPGCNWRARSR